MNIPLNKIIAVVCELTIWGFCYLVAATVALYLGATPEFVKYLGVMIAGAAVHDAFDTWRNTL